MGVVFVRYERCSSIGIAASLVRCPQKEVVALGGEFILGAT